MDFLTFVKHNLKQTDKDILTFIEAIQNLNSIPVSSDPRILGRYLHLKLNSQQTQGFQKFMILYKAKCQINDLPIELQNDEKLFHDAIKLIINLQNNNPDYVSS